MLNSADIKVGIKTILLYIIVFIIFVYGFQAFNSMTLITHYPQIKVIIALLMVMLITKANIPTELAFLISGLLSCFILTGTKNTTLFDYVQYLYNEASSKSILLIAVCGAVVAALTRGDLLEEISKTDSVKDHEKYIDLAHQISVFCLFNKLQSLIQRLKKIFSGLLFLLQNMLVFVSSVVSATTFSAMLKSRTCKSPEEKRYINAGILCMCVSGCLLMYFGMESPWWLFFGGFGKELNVRVVFPLATLIYALFSFIHGYYLLHKAGAFSATENVERYEHPLAKRHFFIYIGLIVAILLITLFTAFRSASLPKNFSQSDYFNLKIILVLILILVSVIAATVITRYLMQKNLMIPHRNESISQLRSLTLGDLNKNSGIKSVIALLVLIITILAFRDMVNACVGNLKTSSIIVSKIDLLSINGAWALFGCLVTFAVVALIGWVLGSNFGAFSIGLIIFSMILGYINALNNNDIKRWVFEGVIIISTFCNQVSPSSSNASALVQGDEDPGDIQKDAWQVKSLFGISALKVQMSVMLICLLLSGACIALGIK
jgi:hypothetical protein